MARLLILACVGIVAVVGALILIESKNGGFDESRSGDRISNGTELVDSTSATNVSRLPPASPTMPEGFVSSQLHDTQKEVTADLQSQQKLFDSVGQMTDEQSQNLSDRLAEARDATIRKYTRIQVKGLVNVLRRMLQTENYPGVVFPYQQLNESPKLSWRVHLLPCLGHQNLYNEFHLQEPWNSPHNIKLLEKMPIVYRHWKDSDDSTRTRILAVDSETALGRQGHLRSLSSVTDPDSDTISLVVVSDQLAVPWTQPADLSLNADTFDETMLKMGNDEIIFATVEGAALYLQTAGSYEVFESLASISGGEPDALAAMSAEKSKLKRQQ